MRTAALVLSATLGLAAAPAALAADVGVSISISQPGAYGRIDLGRFPQPDLYVQQPLLVRPLMVAQPVQPVYLWVPPGHRKNWRHHCGRYGACGTPVYFVQDRWYQSHVAPHRHGYRPGDRRDDRHDYRHDRRDDHRHGHRGKGRDKDD